MDVSEYIAALQLEGGVPSGEASNRPCLFTPFCPTNRGPRMCWFGTTNAGKGTGAHMLWSRLHLLQRIRIFGIDQDEHCGRFLQYLGGRKLTPRDAQHAAQIELHHDDGVVILDLSGVDELLAGPIFAAWAGVVKRHMLAQAARSSSEAVTISENPSGAKALRDSALRSRYWGQSTHVLTQRPSDWFNTIVGRAIQSCADAWWCGAQQPRELDEVASALRLSDEEKELVEQAGIGTGLLVSGQRRVALNLFDKLSPAEYGAFHTDPVVEPVKLRQPRSTPRECQTLRLRRMPDAVGDPGRPGGLGTQAMNDYLPLIGAVGTLLLVLTGLGWLFWPTVTWLKSSSRQ
jgi:hypothetical protein